MKRQIGLNSFLDKTAVFLAVLLPILSPYAIFGVSLINVLTIFLAALFLLSGRIFVQKQLMIFLLLTLLLTFLSFIGGASNLDMLLAIKVFIAFTLFLIVFSTIYNSCDKTTFFKVANSVGLVCALFAIIQFVFVSLNIPIFDGKLPFEMEKYSGFAALKDVTGFVRIHSFFEEPSYLPIFELPLVVYNLKKKKYFFSFVIAASCLLSSSILGIAGLALFIVYALFSKTLERKEKRILLFIVFIGLITVLLLYFFNNAVKKLVDYYLRRYTELDRDIARGTSSFSQRLVGNAALYGEYDLFNKVFGVGINQYSLVFGLTNDYSNDFVCTLLNYGIVGIVLLAAFFIFLFKRAQSNCRIFVFILIMVMAVDHIWFNAYFFYLLGWIMFNCKKGNYYLGLGKCKKRYPLSFRRITVSAQ